MILPPLLCGRVTKSRAKVCIRVKNTKKMRHCPLNTLPPLIKMLCTRQQCIMRNEMGAPHKKGKKGYRSTSGQTAFYDRDPDPTLEKTRVRIRHNKNHL